MDNVEIFIDAEYVIQSLRTIQNKPKGIKVTKEDFNWVNFVEFLARGRNIDKVYYYTARMDESENIDTYNAQTAYLQHIEKALAEYNIQMRLGRMIKTRNKLQSTWNEDRKNKVKNESTYSWIQKGIDTKIVLDLCNFAYTADKLKNNVAILVAGDEDFAETIESLHKLQIRAEVVALNRRDSRISKYLKDSASSVISLDYTKLNKVNIL